MENIVRTIHLDHLIEMVVLTLMAIGTIFVFSAGADVSTDYNLQHFYKFTTLKQIVFFPLAVAIMYAVARTDYRRFSLTRAGILKSYTLYLLILSIVLLLLVLYIGIEKNGVCRWLIVTIGHFSISFQPSELAKWTIIFFLAAFLDKFSDTIRLFWKRFVPICLIAGVIVGLIITQDFGTAIFISLLTFLILLIGGVRWWHFFCPSLIVVPIFCYTIITRIDRFKISYQAKQSLIAIGSGGIFGKGLGRGICKYGYLPEDTTDFIFSIIAEELGFIGAVTIIALFVTLIILSIIVVVRCEDQFGRLLTAVIILTIAIQSAINIGVVTVVLPTKGIPLPFVSAGGTCLLFSAAAVGVLMSIAKQTRETHQ